MLEMPSIESDFPVLGGVDFNLLFCYEIPSSGIIVFRGNWLYTAFIY
jgi:hypothetical protein